VDDHEIAVFELVRDVGEFQSVRRRIDELRALDQRGGLASQVGYQNERTSRFI